MNKPRTTERRLARRKAKQRRDALLTELAKAEQRGDLPRIGVLRAEASAADREARGAA